MFANACRMFAIACMTVALAGCMTQERYQTVSTALEGSAALRAKTIKECTRSEWNPKTTESLALVMDVSENKVPHLACQRVVNAIASGKLSYEDLEKVRQGNITAKIVRIMQDR
ncbi:hypothetical protein [Neorhizobium alkalisoli]|uniref:hypothetical protein n=1 Tax=Neorhizobium alkalisoli TaxID=528178 RepID=UPI000CF9148C|nr:hypothetical protein [Neorhizobium alkalisoli]